VSVAYRIVRGGFFRGSCACQGFKAIWKVQAVGEESREDMNKTLAKMRVSCYIETPGGVTFYFDE
jgi:hypothetical protein